MVANLPLGSTAWPHKLLGQIITVLWPTRSVRFGYLPPQAVAIGLVRGHDQSVDVGDILLLDPPLEAVAEGRLIGRVGATGPTQNLPLEVAVRHEVVELLGEHREEEELLTPERHLAEPGVPDPERTAGRVEADGAAGKQ